jgi:hypothetical protein
MKQRFSFWL